MGLIPFLSPIRLSNRKCESLLPELLPSLPDRSLSDATDSSPPRAESGWSDSPPPSSSPPSSTSPASMFPAKSPTERHTALTKFWTILESPVRPIYCFQKQTYTEFPLVQ